MFREVVAVAEAGAAAEVLGAGVPLATIAHGPAALGSAFSSAPHPARTSMTPVSGAITLVSDEIRITRR
jgi:hypothetical protein